MSTAVAATAVEAATVEASAVEATTPTATEAEPNYGDRGGQLWDCLRIAVVCLHYPPVHSNW